MLEDQVSKLQSRLQHQEDELLKLKDLDSKKEKLLIELKSKWTEVAKNWTEQLQKSQEEVARVKAENQAAKEVRKHLPT
jgi:predicted  nucleic acid-binding Zn-ribbon protein